jgi:hypothetical protein
MTENEIAKPIVDAALKIQATLGPGLLESVYEAVMERELARVSATVNPQPVSRQGAKRAKRGKTCQSEGKKVPGPFSSFGIASP